MLTQISQNFIIVVVNALEKKLMFGNCSQCEYGYCKCCNAYLFCFIFNIRCYRKNVLIYLLYFEL